MRIGGAAGMGEGMQPGIQQSADPESRDISRRIEEAQKRLQELSQNKEISMEEKMKKRQEISQEIADLNNQLRQRQRALRAEKRQEKGTTAEELLGVKEQPGRKAAGGKQGGGLSQSGIEAVISAGSSMKMAQAQGSVATEMKGRVGVLDAEIKLDSARGGSVEAKMEERAELDQKAMEAAASQANILSDAGQKMEEASKSEPQSGQKDSQDAADKADGKTEGKNGLAENQTAQEEQNSAAVYYTPVDVRL